jgi:Bestrophin, RFP-TM, chloride channel
MTPFTYTLLLHRTAWLFCLLLPLGLVGTLGMATPAATTILAYAFFGLDALGEELEEPFGLSQNALSLDALVRAIEIASLEALGETELPPPPTSSVRAPLGKAPVAPAEVWRVRRLSSSVGRHGRLRAPDPDAEEGTDARLAGLEVKHYRGLDSEPGRSLVMPTDHPRSEVM